MQTMGRYCYLTTYEAKRQYFWISEVVPEESVQVVNVLLPIGQYQVYIFWLN